MHVEKKKSLKEHLNADMQKVITFADFFACKFFLLLSRRSKRNFLCAYEEKAMC